MAYPAKKHYNRADYVISLGDQRLAREEGHDDFFYCGREGCGPSFGPQCEDCKGYTSTHIPPFKCFNRKGYEMILADDGNYYCGKQYSGLTELFGLNGGRCHPSKKWQCKHCQGFSKGSSEPPLHGRHEFSVPEKCEPQPFKNVLSKNHDI